MSKSEINYQKLVQGALRGVVKDLLNDVAERGLPGEHHFYIAFKTQAPGVSIPAALMARYPEEMTIVLQHKFWGLEVFEDRFEVDLSFSQQMSHLVIPFAALIGFADPSAQFALEFQDEAAAQDAAAPDARPSKEDALAAAQDAALAAVLESGDVDAADTDDTDDTNDDPAQESAKVVTLDAFRKK